MDALPAAALLSPFRYSGLIWATVLGWLVWSHLPDFWSWVGALVIIASSFYVAEAGRPMPAPAARVRA